MFVCHWLNVTFLWPRINYNANESGRRKKASCISLQPTGFSKLKSYPPRSTGRFYPREVTGHSSDLQLLLWITHQLHLLRVFHVIWRLVCRACPKIESLGNGDVSRFNEDKPLMLSQTHCYVCTLTLFFPVASVFCAEDPPCSCRQCVVAGLRLERSNGLLWNCLMVTGGSSFRVTKGGDTCLWDQSHPDNLTWRKKEKKKGRWKWERIKSERKFAQGCFRHRTYNIMIFLIKEKRNILLSSDPECH